MHLAQVVLCFPFFQRSHAHFLASWAELRTRYLEGSVETATRSVSEDVEGMLRSPFPSSVAILALVRRVLPSSLWGALAAVLGIEINSLAMGDVFPWWLLTDPLSRTLEAIGRKVDAGARVIAVEGATGCGKTTKFTPFLAVSYTHLTLPTKRIV